MGVVTLVRTAYNALVNDTGAGNDGTILTKALLASVFLDPIDVALASLSFVEQTTSATGLQHDFNLTGRCTYLRCTGAAPEFTGFRAGGLAPVGGEVLIIDNVDTGTNTVAVAHEHTGSTAAYRIACPSVSGQIVGAKGRMLLVHDPQSGRWREALLDPGAPWTPAFAAGDFVGNGTMTWTVDAGDVRARNYTQRGRDVRCNYDLTTTSISGTPTAQCLIAHPRGWTTSPYPTTTVGMFSDNGGTFVSAFVMANAANLRCYRDMTTSTNLSASTNLTGMQGSITFGIT